MKKIISIIIGVLLAAGVIIWGVHQNTVKSQEIAKYEQNYKAATDSLKQYQLANGQLLAEKASWVLAEQEMTNRLSLKDTELADIQKKLKSTVALLADVNTEVRIDSILIESEPEYIAQDTLAAPFDWADDWVNLAGRFEYGSGKLKTTISNLNISTPLTIGLTEDYQYFVTTPNPHVNITHIESVVNERIVPKQKHWGLGINVGPGIYYDFRSKDVGWGIGAQFGLTYKF